ncbi:unnamed protein product [Adineta ricciae]|uniref:L-xylulose reductase-like protein n=1 Tax=Adineta ricciae TaxID=249248 RepID=A0A814G7C1_ADIRI|nr:unnamed protein product [Adineta ricciae]
MFPSLIQSANDSQHRSNSQANHHPVSTNLFVKSSSKTVTSSKRELTPTVTSSKTVTDEHLDSHSNLDERNFFENKTACVTGAGRGIGRAIAVRLAQLGCRVIAIGRTEDYLIDLAKEHQNIVPVAVDVKNWTATKTAIKPYLPIQLLVNNAGILMLNDFLNIKREDFDESFQTNVRSVISMTQEITKDLISRSMPGSVVNVSSIASEIAAKKFMIYSGTKACMDAFTRNMAGELGPYQIRVNSVQPTVVLTDMGKAAGWENQQQSAPLLAKTPLGRFAEIHEVVEPIIFLLSDKSSMITGACLPIDGGYLVT